MSWNAILSVACIISLTFPVAILVYHRLYTHPSLAALMISYIFSLLDNMIGENLLPVPEKLARSFQLMINYLDIPLMLVALLFFCPNKAKGRLVNLLILSVLAFEMVVTLIYGFNVRSVVYILGPSVAVLILYTSYVFARQVKFTILRRTNQGKTVMLASILFSYACYSIIYYFFYIQQTPYTGDVFSLYYISMIIHAILMTIGLYLMRNRLKDLESVQVTRKELAMFFGH